MDADTLSYIHELEAIMASDNSEYHEKKWAEEKLENLTILLHQLEPSSY